jgi:DNA-binding NtrC family response regulator
MVAANSFRSDLYYRLNAASIIVPPLRERPEEIEPLAAYFAGLFGSEIGKEINYFSRASMRTLADYAWPGNLRELRHAIESAVMLAEGDRIDIDELPESVRQIHSPMAANGLSSNGNVAVAADLHEAEFGSYSGEEKPAMPAESFALNDAIKSALVRALRKANGNCHLAAKLLGISRYTVYRMMARFGLGQVKSYREVSARDAIDHNALLSVPDS